MREVQKARWFKKFSPTLQEFACFLNKNTQSVTNAKPKIIMVKSKSWISALLPRRIHEAVNAKVAKALILMIYLVPIQTAQNNFSVHRAQ